MSARLGRSCLLAALLVAPLCRADRTPPVTTLEGHKGWVGAVAFSPDGKRLATGSADRTARTWNVADGRREDAFEGHTDTVCAIAFAPDGAVVTGSHDGTVRLWRTPQRSTILEKRRGAVLAVAVSPDGKAVASGGMDGVITLLDPSGEKKPTRLAGHKSWVSSLAFSADGTRFVSGSSDGTARLWDAKTGKPVATFALADPREIRCVALSPDGKTVAAGVRFGKVEVWDVASGKRIARIDAHDGEAWSVCFTPDGKTLVSGGGDWGKPGTVRQWETKTWTGGATLSHPAEVLCVAVSPDGRRLAACGAGRTVRVWDLRSTK